MQNNNNNNNTMNNDNNNNTNVASSVKPSVPPPTSHVINTSSPSKSSPSPVSKYMWKIPKVSGKAPGARFGHATCLFHNSVGHECMLLFGGWDGMNMLSDLHVFDLVTQEWSQPTIAGRIPSPRAGHSCTTLYFNEDNVVSGYSNYNNNNSSSSSGGGGIGKAKVLLIGGGNGLNYLSDIHVLDLSTWEWSQPTVSSQVKVYIKDDLILNQNLYRDCITDTNSPVHTPKDTPEESDLVLIGTQTAEIMDTGFGTPSKNAKINNKTVVTMKEVYPAPRSRHSIVVTKQGKLIMFGGGGSRDKIFDDLWVLNPVKMEWSQPKTFNKPSKRWGHGSVIVDNRMYIFGGVYEAKMLNELYEMDVNTYQWRQITLPKAGPIPAPRAAHTCTMVHNKYLFILWGGDDNRFLDDLFVIDMEYTVAKRLTFKTPKARCAHTATLVGDKTMYVFGGGDKTIRFKELYILDVDIAIEKSGIQAAVALLPKPINLSSREEISTPNSPNSIDDTIESKQEDILSKATLTAEAAFSKSTTITRDDTIPNKPDLSIVTRSTPTSNFEAIDIVESPFSAVNLSTDYSDNAINNTSGGSTIQNMSNSSLSSHMPPPPPLPPKINSKKPLPPFLSTSNQYMTVQSEIKVDDGSDLNFALRNQTGPRRRKRSVSRKGGIHGQEQQVYSAKDAKEITNWLVSLGLGRYAAIFIHEEIDMDCVPLLTEADLFRIGVNKYGPRKKILAAAREFSSPLQEHYEDEQDTDFMSHRDQPSHTAVVSVDAKASAASTDSTTAQHTPPPPPPPMNYMYYYQQSKSCDRHMSQLTQAVSNLSMACESMNETIKNIGATMNMMVNQLAAQQQQQQQQQQIQQPQQQQQQQVIPQQPTIQQQQPSLQFTQQSTTLQQQQQHYINYMRQHVLPGLYQSVPPSTVYVTPPNGYGSPGPSTSIVSSYNSPPPPPPPPNNIRSDTGSYARISQQDGNSSISMHLSESVLVTSSVQQLSDTGSSSGSPPLESMNGNMNNNSGRKRRNRRRKNSLSKNGSSIAGSQTNTVSQPHQQQQQQQNQEPATPPTKPSWFELTEMEEQDLYLSRQHSDAGKI